MAPRSTKEWIGRRPESMPSIHVRLRIYSRQNGLCACGCRRVMNLDRDKIDCDHILALRDGGENRETNLQLLLHEHHQAKTTAENIARGEERRHKAKAFTTASKSKWGSRGFAPSRPQHRATTPLTKRVGHFEEQP